jgi:hypothetical protein
LEKTQKKINYGHHPHEATVRFAYFNHNHFHAARLLGFSDSGISFNSKTPVKVGTTILIKLENLSKHTCKEIGMRGFKTIALMETHLCREVGDQYGSEYEIGAKFFMYD